MAKKESTPTPGPDKKTIKEIEGIKKTLKSIQEIKPPDLSETVDQASKYLKNLEAVKAVQAELNALAEFSVDLTKQGHEALKEARKTGVHLTSDEKTAFAMKRKALKVQEDQAKHLQEELKLRGEIYKTGARLSKELKAREKSAKKLAELEDKYKDSVGEGLGFIDDLNDKIKEIPIVGGILSKALGLDEMKEELTKKFSGYIAKAIDPASAKQKEASDAALKGYDEQVAKLNLVTDAAGNITGVMEEIPEAAEEAASAIGSITDETKKASKGAEEIGDGLEKSAPKAKGLIASMGPMLVLALAIGAAMALFEGALELDKEITELARGLGTSKEEAHEVHHELTAIASQSKIVGVNAAALGESYMELAKSMGVSKLANKEMAETQIYLKKQIGMSADEASSFQQMSMAGGKSAEQNLAVIQAGVKEFSGGLMNYKEVAKDIGTSSKAVQASYKGNIAALTKAVVTAKKFGMTLDQTKKSADSILDVESSLEAEMKANVLTGKNMNLNAARELALKGDTAGAMEEMMAQAGGYDELMEMAPYQQKAVADAMGMTVDEMIKGAEHQKNLNNMAKDLGITLDKNGRMSEADLQKALSMGDAEAKKLALQQQQADAQEKMALAVDNIKAAFASIMDGPLGMIVDAFSAILGNAAVLKGIITAIAIAAIPFAVSMAASAIAAISTMSAMTLGIGALAAAAGIAVTVAAMNSESDKSKAKTESVSTQEDAQIDPDGGLVVKGKKGTFQLHKDDSLIAGTDLDAPSKESSSVASKPVESDGGSILGDIASTLMNSLGASSAPAPASGNAEVVALLKELIAKVDQPVNINIGGRVVQELDRMITMNKTYNTKGDNTYGAT
jgi:hypothetical protein